MLEIINNLSPFIEDCYEELGVREYSKIARISPPTSSKILKKFESEGLLKKRKDRRYLLFRANRNSEILKTLSEIYWKEKLKGFIEFIDSELHPNAVIIFGSLAKLETKKDSDIDIAIFTKIKKKLNLEKYEKLYEREMHIFIFSSLDKINRELKNNFLNGYLIKGEFR